MFYFLALLLTYNNVSSINNETIFYIYIYCAQRNRYVRRVKNNRT